MKITEHEQPFPYMVIEDIFKPKQWQEIVDELEWFRRGTVLQETEKTGSASYSPGDYKASKKGFFIEELYRNTELSKIHTNIHNTFPYIFNTERKGWYWKFPMFLDMETAPLISYYENTNYYSSHDDESLYTYLFWYYDEPKQFDGGELIFTDYGIKIDIKPNSGVMFPGPIRHEVTEITNCSEGKGRFAVSTFLVPNIPEQNQ